jgi:predicted nucleotide-binding protein
MTDLALAHVVQPAGEIVDRWKKLGDAEGSSFDDRGLWMSQDHAVALVRPGSEFFPVLQNPVTLTMTVTFDLPLLKKREDEPLRIFDTDFSIGKILTVIGVLGTTVSIDNLGKSRPALFYTSKGSILIAPRIEAENPVALGEVSRLPGMLERRGLKFHREEKAATVELDPRRVFVVHGRNESLRSDLFAYLRAIGLRPIEWSEAVKLTGKASPYIGEILEAAFRSARAVVVLLSPDDEGRLRDEFQRSDDPLYEKELTPQPRQNVVFEAGLAFGYKPERTILVKVGDVRPFSDIYGRHEVRLTNDARRRKELANRLSSIGCAVDLMGDDWLSVGNFGS